MRTATDFVPVRARIPVLEARYPEPPNDPPLERPMTSAEQYLLESINRARLDPVGEARRFGIDLNQGLEPGRLDGSARQPLAPNALLNEAAARHSLWMLENDVFSHTGAQGSSAGDRMMKAGYVFEGSWSWGENLSWSGSTGAVSLDTEIGQQHRDLFLSPGHRVNILQGFFAEVGLAQEAGKFTDGLTYNASMVTENFARSGAKLFLTGVVYTDRDKDNFYSIGEGVGGTGIRAGATTTSSAAAGGYALGLPPAASVEAAFVRDGAPEIRFKVELSTANAKVDLVNGTRLESSAHLTLLSGTSTATLLGTGKLNLTGSTAADKLTGNSGANKISGAQGNDRISGGGGADTLYGNAGNDLLRGGSGKDILYGGAGKDLFRFDTTPNSTTNVDRIMDFSVADDTIQLENAIFTRFGKTTTGPIPSSSFKANTTGRASDANDYIVYETDTGKLFYDTNGNAAGGATQIALLGVNLSLTAADFVLV